MSKSKQYAAMDVEEGQTLLHTNNREADAQRLRRNLIIWAGLGLLLVLLIVLAAVTTGHKQVQEEDEPTRLLGGSPGDKLDQVLIKAPGLQSDFAGRPRIINVDHAAVAADTSRCSDVGIKVLKEGGNAVDAAVAVALCVGVVNPFGSGIGGGTFINIRMGDGTAITINAREQAPMAATWDMFVNKSSDASVTGGLAIAVPMELKGLRVAWSSYGSKVVPWRRLVRPAALIAERGFAAHPELINIMSGPDNEKAVLTTPLLRQWLAVKDENTSEWRLPAVGEHCCKNLKLAQTLYDVADRGVDWLYSGSTAETLAKEIRDAGGIMTAADLSGSLPRVESPVTATIAGMTFQTMPPPSSGAAALAALRILEGFPSLRNSSDKLLIHHRLVECMKHAFGLRLSLGDPGTDPKSKQFTDIQAVMADLQNKTFIDELRAMTSDDHVLNITQYGGRYNSMVPTPEDHGTSHISVVDSDGNAVALTTSINLAFGSLVVSNSTGILFNNHMDDFSRPGTQNKWGLHSTAPNYPAAGKIPLSSMSPTIVVDVVGKREKVRQVLGASGGPRILSSVLTVLARQQLLGFAPWDAVVTPKVHHQLKYHNKEVMLWENGTKFRLNITVPEDIVDYLQAKGNPIEAYELFQQEGLGVVQSITVSDDGLITAVSDPRKDGAPAGF